MWMDFGVLYVWEGERRGFLSSNLCDVESLIKSAIFSLSYCVLSQKHTLFSNLLRFTAEMSEITVCSIFNMTCFYVYLDVGLGYPVSHPFIVCFRCMWHFRAPKK